MSTFFRVLVALVLVGLVAVAGIGIYNAGVSAGVAEGARVASESGDASVLVNPYIGYPGYGWHGFGFGIFGLFFWILAIFLIIGLVRAAVGWGRWGGPRRPGGWSDRQSQLAEMHRELHRADAPGGGSSSAGGGAMGV
jgi:hypothetical protein